MFDNTLTAYGVLVEAAEKAREDGRADVAIEYEGAARWVLINDQMTALEQRLKQLLDLSKEK